LYILFFDLAIMARLSQWIYRHRRSSLFQIGISKGFWAIRFQYLPSLRQQTQTS